MAVPSAMLHVHSRHEVEVGVQRAVGAIEQHHAHAAGLTDGQALVDACGHAALADHDLARHLGWIENGRHRRQRRNTAPLESDRRRPDRRRSSRSAGAGPTAVATEAPVYVTPLPSVTDPEPLRLCVPAATVVSHGPGCATVLVVGPLLPAEAATNTPASAAYMNAISTASRKLVVDPLIEKLMTSTPSATAWSMAATLSVLKQLPPVGRLPADLVRGDARARRDAAGGSEHCGCAGGRHALLPPAVDGSVRAVTAEVTRRIEFPGQLRVDAGVAAPPRVEVLRANQLLVAVRRIELFAGHAPAVPAGDLLIVQLAVLAGVAVRPRAVREAQALRPDAAVDDADNDVLALAPSAAQKPSGPLRPRKSGVEDVLSGRAVSFVDRQHARRRRELLGLRRASVPPRNH